MTDRIHNFNAGPGVLPEVVLRRAQQDLWNIAGSGIGIAEHSHRGKVFEKVIAEAEAAARDLAGIPERYRVLLLRGGPTQQFAMVPMNLLGPGETADYLVTGVWAQKALAEARKFGPTHVAVDGEGEQYTRIPPVSAIRYSAPPTLVISMVGLVLQWIRSGGGLAAMADRNEAKAGLLYDFLDGSTLFRGTVHPDSRSLMNVCFRTPSEALDAKFVTEASQRGFEGLKGHRASG